MKMINILKYIGATFLMFGLLSLSSCTLERESYNEIYPENFFKTESDADKALTSLYAPFTTYWLGLYSAEHVAYVVGSEFTTDILDTPWTGYDIYHEHRWDPNVWSYPMELCEKIYPKIQFLTRIRYTEKVFEGLDINEDMKKQFIAEAQCLYGWLGFILYDLFGPVPLATDETMENPTEIVPLPRLSDEEYCKIMCDKLILAAENLPEEPREWGRVTKGMAKMLLLKFYMINHNYTDAEVVARELVAMEQSGIYALEKDYAKVFNKSNARNKEIIMAIPCGEEQPNFWLPEVLPSDYPYPSDVKKWNGYHMRWEFYDTYEEGDERLKTIIAEYTNISGEHVDRNSAVLEKGAIPLKIGVDPDARGSNGTTDQVVYRYADVLLTLAECINMNNGSPTQEAIDLVNRVRSRVKLPNLTSSQTASKEAFNEALLTERGHEFYCEGLRRQDLIRFGKFTECSKSNYPNSQSNEFKNRFPIPPYYILESKGVVTQNPGY